MKLLLSAIACDPCGGSESIYGWYVVSALAKHHECYVITEKRFQKSLEESKKRGIVPDSIHFRYLSMGDTYHPNRLVARLQSWRWYQKFQQNVLKLAAEWHQEIGFDLAQHVTYTTWRVPSELWKLGIPFVWGPISGTEIFPPSCMSSLSFTSKCFEIFRRMQTYFALKSQNTLQCARKADAIPVPHRQALEFLAQIRGSEEGVSICHNFFFPDARIEELKSRHTPRDIKRPLRAFAAGNLEGRKGVAIALQAIAEAKARGIRVEYQVTSRGPELEHLKQLARSLGISDQVILGERFEAEDFAEALGSFDLCLVPSLRDGAGLSIMEAMLAGCVPIVADWCGPAEFVTEDCGYKVPVTHPKRMAQDIARILCQLDSDRDLLRRLGTVAGERIRNSYNERQFLDSMNQIYERVLASDR